MDVIPNGKAAGYPARINFNNLPKRLQQSSEALQAYIDRPQLSPFFADAKAHLDKVGRKASAAIASLDTFEKEQVG